MASEQELLPRRGKKSSQGRGSQGSQARGSASRAPARRSRA